MLRSNRTTTTNLCACVPSRISLRSSLSAIRQSTANVESLTHTHNRRLGVYAVYACGSAEYSATENNGRR